MTPNRRLWVGGVALSPDGREPRARKFPASGLGVGRRSAKEGRRRGLATSWREKTGDVL